MPPTCKTIVSSSISHASRMPKPSTCCARACNRLPLSRPSMRSMPSLRVLAQTAVAQRTIPLHTNSAVDGYAFAHNGDIEKSGAVLPVMGRAAAGHALAGPAAPARRFVFSPGAVMPPELDTVVMQEDVTLETISGIAARADTPRLQTRRQRADGRRGCRGRRGLVRARTRFAPAGSRRLGLGGTRTGPLPCAAADWRLFNGR